MKTPQTFTILIWANKAKATKSGLLPLFARVTCNGRRSEISLKRKVPEEKWNPESNKCTGVGPEPMAINQFIDQTKSRLFKIYDNLLLNDEPVNPQTIKDLFLGKNVKEKTLLEVVAIHNPELKDRISIDYSKSTHTKFNTLEKKIRKYCKSYLKKHDLFLSQLNYEFVKNFAYFLQSREKIKSNTTMKYVRMLKKIMNEAVRRSWLDKNPFQEFKCTFKWAERDVLTMDEVKLIEEKEFNLYRLALVRDLFIFSCYTGISYADIIRLQKKDISSN